MAIPHPRFSMAPIAGLAIAAFILGSAIGGVALAALTRSQLDDRDRSIQAARTRIEMLTLVVQHQTEAVVSLATQPALAPQPTPQPMPAATPASTPSQAVALAMPIPQAISRPTRHAANVPPKTELSMSALILSVMPKERADPVQISAADLSTARSSNKIEAVHSAKIGVDKITTDAVIMRSGTRIQVGDRFTSGERLLSVDPATGQIVTNERTILLL